MVALLRWGCRQQRERAAARVLKQEMQVAAMVAVVMLWVAAAQSRLGQLLRLQLWGLQCRCCRQVLCLLQPSAKQQLQTQVLLQTHHLHQRQPLQ
jgi:hypothetical protein